MLFVKLLWRCLDKRLSRLVIYYCSVAEWKSDNSTSACMDKEGSGSLKRQFATTSERTVKIEAEAYHLKSGFLLSQGSN